MSNDMLFDFSSLQRLEEFPSSTSCIKFYGRSILPPILSPEQRVQILRIREEAISKELDLLKRKQEKCNQFENIAVTPENNENTQFESEQNVDKVFASTASDQVPAISSSFDLSNVQISSHDPSHISMHDSLVAASKIPTDNIYITVHKSCLTSSIHENHNVVLSSATHQHPNQTLCNNMSCKNVNHCAVSDFSDEDSVLDGTECGSLGTVILNSPHKVETDCESVATTITQSTDLDKYMDSSFEMSHNSECSTMIGDGQEISQLYYASNSEDENTETPVNVDNEQTVAMENKISEDEIDRCDIQSPAKDRGGLRKADSVDGYVKMLSLCARNLYAKKFHSEENVSSKTDPDICHGSKAPYNEINPEFHLDPNEKSLKEDGAKLFRPGHQRQRSYTLDQPSPALVKAHANCNCQLDSELKSPPHSCALRSTSDSKVENQRTAFKKEKVSLTLPVTMKKLDLSVASSRNECHSQTDSGTGEISNNETSVYLSFESIPGTKDPCEEMPNIQVVNDKNFGEDEWTRIYNVLQETHKKKVEKLLEEQHQQWLKLQMEFKEQEKLLCEKLEALNTPEVEDTQSVQDSESQNQTEETSNQVSQSKDELVNVISSDVSPNSSNDQDKQIHLSVESNVLTALEENATVNSDVNLPDSASMSLCSDAESEENKTTFWPNNKEFINQRNSSKQMYELLNQSDHVVDDKPISSCSKENFDDEVRTRSVAVQSAVEVYSPIKKLSDGSCHDGRLQSAERDNVISSQECNFIEQQGEQKTKKSISTQVFRSDRRTLSSRDNVNNSKATSVSRKLNDAPNQTRNYNTSAKNRELSRKVQAANIKNSSILSNQNLVNKMPITAASLCVQANKAKIHSPDFSSTYSIKLHSINFDDPLLKRKFDKVSAVAKGYLHRCLLNTDHVQGLLKTLKDTMILMKKMDEDFTRKQSEVTEHDVEFYRQLIVQLTTTFDKIYDIFCTITPKERMQILSESRQQTKLKSAQQSLSDISLDSPDSIIVQSAANNQKPKISSATIKALQRKKMNSIIIDGRTYTFEDFKSKRDLRTRSSNLSKSHLTSPTSIYKASAALAPKRKISGALKNTATRRSLLPK